VRTLRAIDPRQLHERRLEDANRRVGRATERVIEERVALVLDRGPDEHRADGGAHAPLSDVRVLSTEHWALSQAAPLSRLRW